MPKKSNQTWVSPIKATHQWKVHHPRAERASGIFDTKNEALDVGRAISRNQKTEFIAQRHDGPIHIRDSHGNDPRATRG